MGQEKFDEYAALNPEVGAVFPEENEEENEADLAAAVAAVEESDEPVAWELGGALVEEVEFEETEPSPHADPESPFFDGSDEGRTD